MRVLVTGAGGLIGSEVVGQLLDRSHEVVALDRPGSMARLSRWQGKMTTQVADLDDDAATRAAHHRIAPGRDHSPGLVCRSQGLPDVGPEPRIARDDDTLRRSGARIRLPQAGDRRVVRRIRTARSTARRRRSGGPGDALRCLQARGVDRVADARRRRRCRAVMGANLSPAWPARRPSAPDPMGCAGASGRSRRRPDRRHTGAGSPARRGCRRRVWSRLLAPGASGIYNVCSGQPVTLRQVLETVGEIVGGTALLRFGARPHRPGETMFLAGDPGRLRALGWSPRFGLEDGLRDALLGGN